MCLKSSQSISKHFTTSFESSLFKVRAIVELRSDFRCCKLSFSFWLKITDIWVL